MTQNRSMAVMQSRASSRDDLDFYPTPPWATRALCEWLIEVMQPLDLQTAWDPACGDCDMVRPLLEYFEGVFASDIKDYCEGRGKEQDCVCDFLLEKAHPPSFASHPRDWIVVNPPFQLGDQFATMALRHARCGVALLARTAFLESIGRYESLYLPTPPSDILQFVERVPIFKGRLDRYGSTATAYCWLTWRKGSPPGTRFHWIKPGTRQRLERDSDYPAEAAE